jgi:hypothetical protein
MILQYLPAVTGCGICVLVGLFATAGLLLERCHKAATRENSDRRRIARRQIAD